ncbi:MAG: hypothetical protein ACYCWE_21880 [Eubacteriales bacterium]
MKDLKTISQTSKSLPMFVKHLILIKSNILYFTYCTINIGSVSSQTHKDNWIAVLGIKFENLIYLNVTPYDINLYELGRVLYEETRLKILNMLAEKEMYCAESQKK